MLLKAFKIYSISLFICSLVLACVFFFIEHIEEKDFSTIDNNFFLNQKFTNQNQKSISISDFKNQVVLVDFWFAGCIPCLKEMKYYPEILNKYENKITIISVSIDSEEYLKKILRDKPKPWDFIKINNKRWHFTTAEKSLIDKLKINSFPTYFIINEDGKVISSPKSGIYGIERELNYFINLPISYNKFYKNVKIKELKKAFLLFNVIFVIIFLLRRIIIFVKKSVFK